MGDKKPWEELGITQAEYEDYEADMAENPYGNDEPDVEAMYEDFISQIKDDMGKLSIREAIDYISNDGNKLALDEVPIHSDEIAILAGKCNMEWNVIKELSHESFIFDLKCNSIKDDVIPIIEYQRREAGFRGDEDNCPYYLAEMLYHGKSVDELNDIAADYYAASVRCATDANDKLSRLKSDISYADSVIPHFRSEIMPDLCQEVFSEDEKSEKNVSVSTGVDFSKDIGDDFEEIVDEPDFEVIDEITDENTVQNDTAKPYGKRMLNNVENGVSNPDYDFDEYDDDEPDDDVKSPTGIGRRLPSGVDDMVSDIDTQYGK